MRDAPSRRLTRVAGIILAAGESLRMGQTKQLIDVGGRTMPQRVAQAALSSQLDSVYVVVGHRAVEVRASLRGMPVTIVENPGYREGLGSSVRRAVGALPAETEVAMFLLGDQPGVTAGLIDLLLAQSTPENIVAARQKGGRMNPTVFGRRWFPELARCSGDTGGRWIIDAHPEAVALVETDADLRDIDTPEDLAAILLALKKSPLPLGEGKGEGPSPAY